jgi:hypothetical protein
MLSPLLVHADSFRGHGAGPMLGPGFQVEWITVHGDLKKGETPVVTPGSTYVTRGNKVLWANGTDTPMRIRFGSGKKCKEVSQTAFIGYQWATLSGCIATPVMSPKTVLEFFPNDGGVWDWEIEFVGTKQKLTGRLKVF